MKKTIKNSGILVAVILAVIIIALTIGSYQPPLMDNTGRNPLEIVCDFFAFGWHFSRHIWMERSRDWKNSNRQRLLAYWYHPNFAGFEDLREKSLFELGSTYERLLLPDHASEIFLQACRRNPKGRWFIGRIGERMLALKKWDKLEELRCLLVEIDPKDQQARSWLEERESALALNRR